MDNKVISFKRTRTKRKKHYENENDFKFIINPKIDNDILLAILILILRDNQGNRIYS